MNRLGRRAIADVHQLWAMANRSWSACSPVPELTGIWRLLTRAELRHAPRVSAFFDFIVEEIDALRPIITG